MAFIQTSVQRYRDPAFEGAMVDQQVNNLFTRRADEEIPFGKVVLQGATDGSCKLPDDSGAAYLGVSVRDQSTGAESPNSFPANSSVRIADKGTIWVRVGAAVNAGERAAYLTADGSIVKSGTADSTGIDGGKFMTSAGTGELAQLKLS